VLSLAEVLTRKGVTLEAAAGAAAAKDAAGSGAVLALLAQGGGCTAVATAVSNCCPYVARQAGDVAALRRDEVLLLLPGLDYGAMALAVGRGRGEEMGARRQALFAIKPHLTVIYGPRLGRGRRVQSNPRSIV
jgi:hypothetical protein